mmetsp:Transcript_50840/g.157410  ORF Transcript_50840/g.157410 Transcript_50840/m.157410 type:complete len:338 (-) Transcript_50840:14-1027(-)
MSWAVSRLGIAQGNAAGCERPRGGEGCSPPPPRLDCRGSSHRQRSGGHAGPRDGSAGIRPPQASCARVASAAPRAAAGPGGRAGGCVSPRGTAARVEVEAPLVAEDEEVAAIGRRSRHAAHHGPRQEPLRRAVRGPAPAPGSPAPPTRQPPECSPQGPLGPSESCARSFKGPGGRSRLAGLRGRCRPRGRRARLPRLRVREEALPGPPPWTGIPVPATRPRQAVRGLHGRRGRVDVEEQVGERLLRLRLVEPHAEVAEVALALPPWLLSLLGRPLGGVRKGAAARPCPPAGGPVPARGPAARHHHGCARSAQPGSRAPGLGGPVPQPLRPPLQPRRP